MTDQKLYSEAGNPVIANWGEPTSEYTFTLVEPNTERIKVNGTIYCSESFVLDLIRQQNLALLDVLDRKLKKSHKAQRAYRGWSNDFGAVVQEKAANKAIYQVHVTIQSLRESL